MLQMNAAQTTDVVARTFDDALSSNPDLLPSFHYAALKKGIDAREVCMQDICAIGDAVVFSQERSPLTTLIALLKLIKRAVRTGRMQMYPFHLREALIRQYVVSVPCPATEAARLKQIFHLSPEYQAVLPGEEREDSPTR